MFIFFSPFRPCCVSGFFKDGVPDGVKESHFSPTCEFRITTFLVPRREPGVSGSIYIFFKKPIRPTRSQDDFTASSQTGTADYNFYPFRYHLPRPFSAWNSFSGHLARICTYPFRLGWRGGNVREDPDTWPLGKSMSERPSISYHRVTDVRISLVGCLSDSIVKEGSL